MAKKILRINMTELKATYEDVPEKWARWAGRGLTSAIVCDEVDPTCHPLGPNNKLVIAPGWVSGTPAAPSSGRTSFGGKSPLTGGIKESNAGGLSSQKIARLAWQPSSSKAQPEGQMVYRGRHQGWCQVRGCRSIWWARACTKSMRCCGRNTPRPAVIGIGPAGEMKLSNAGISRQRPGKHARPLCRPRRPGRGDGRQGRQGHGDR